jgi:hypothetical protein
MEAVCFSRQFSEIKFPLMTAYFQDAGKRNVVHVPGGKVRGCKGITPLLMKPVETEPFPSGGAVHQVTTLLTVPGPFG